MIAGKLEAKGRSASKITLTLKEDRIEENEPPLVMDTETPVTMMADEPVSNEVPKVPVRLHGGRSPTEGRLQVSYFYIFIWYGDVLVVDLLFTSDEMTILSKSSI